MGSVNCREHKSRCQRRLMVWNPRSWHTASQTTGCSRGQLRTCLSPETDRVSQHQPHPCVHAKPARVSPAGLGARSRNQDPACTLPPPLRLDSAPQSGSDWLMMIWSQCLLFFGLKVGHCKSGGRNLTLFRWSKGPAGPNVLPHHGQT